MSAEVREGSEGRVQGKFRKGGRGERSVEKGRLVGERKSVNKRRGRGMREKKSRERNNHL